jgi:hypothetical protein
MAEGHLALSMAPPPPSPADADYDILCQALMETSRGRWFLEEYARRNRHADTCLVLDAIGRVETTIQEEHARQASQGMRVELLEMARTIAQTRADVAETQAAAPASPGGEDIVAAAERLQEVAWTMRERGLDMATCDQIADLSAAILSASSLRDPSNGRARKLAEALRALEQRVDAMLAAPEIAEPAVAVLPTPSPVEAVPEPPIEPAPDPAIELDPLPVEPLLAEPVPVEAQPVDVRPIEPPVDDVSPIDFLPAAPLPVTPTVDPLAALKAMSSEERLALFT